MIKVRSSVMYPIEITPAIKIDTLVSAFTVSRGEGYIFPGESHDFWEFVYVDSGTVHITASKKKYILKKGDFIFHKPNEFHAISADKKTPANVFVVSFVSTSTNMAYFKNKISTLNENLRPYIEILLKEGKKTFDLSHQNPLSVT